MELLLVGESPSLFDAMGGAILGSAIGLLLDSVGNIGGALDVLALRVSGAFFLFAAGILVVRSGRIVGRFVANLDALWKVKVGDLKQLSSLEDVQASKDKLRMGEWARQKSKFRSVVVAALACVTVSIMFFAMAGLRDRHSTESRTLDAPEVERKDLGIPVPTTR